MGWASGALLLALVLVVGAVLLSAYWTAALFPYRFGILDIVYGVR
jgi:hypothetical protein